MLRLNPKRYSCIEIDVSSLESQFEASGFLDNVEVNQADETERVQRKVFMNWINYHVPNCIKNNLIEELRDGTKLLALLEALTGEKLPGERGKRLRRPHFISNVNIVLQLLERRRVKLVNIHATDIVDGNPCIILGLIWTMILHFHIEEYVRLNALEHQRDSTIPHHSQRHISSPAPISSDTARSSLRSTLLDNINRRFGLNLNDFGRSWRDGEAILAIIDSILPQLKAREKGRAVITNRARLQLAFDLAERYLGIIKLLDAEDMDVDNPDERSMMTYASQFLQKQIPINQPEVLMSSCVVHSTKLRSDEGSSIRKWIANLVKTGINQSNLAQFQQEQAELRSEFDRVKDSLDPETIQNWYLIENELAIAKSIEDWIGIAEKMLASYSVPTSGEQVEEQLRCHKLFFSCLPKLEANSNLWESIANHFKQTIRLADEWLEAMLEASRRWEQYHLAADELKGWITTAETKLINSHMPHSLNQQPKVDYLSDLKKFFSSRAENEKILHNFVASCNDVLATLPEFHQTGLKETLRGLENRFHEITNFKAPQHLIQFEFDLTESNFLSRLTNDPENEEPILEDLNAMENLGTVYWKRFNDKSILDRAMFNRREFIKRKKKLRQDIAFIRQETIDLISVAESQLKSITLDSQIEVLRHNEYTLSKIREQLNVLRCLTNEANVDLEKELKEFESQLERLAEQLKAKKKEKIINWLENEAPQKLELFRSGSDHSLKDEINKYRQMIIEEKELNERVRSIDVQLSLIDMERCKVGSVKEAKQKVKSYQSLRNLAPQLEKYLKFLEEVVLVEWEAVETIKNDLKSWLQGRNEFNRDELREKKDECDKLLERFDKNRTIIEKLASDSALRSLQKDLSDIICDYDQFWRTIEEDAKNKGKPEQPASNENNQNQENNPGSSRIITITTQSSPNDSSSSTRQVKSIIEETVQRYEKTEKYEITRREKREEIIGGDIVGSAANDITLHVDSTRDVIEIKNGGEGGKSGDQKISVSHFEETKETPASKVDEMTKEEMTKVETLVEQLKQIDEWCINNNLDALLKKELLACDESSFTKLRELREKWTHQVNLLSKLSEELTKLLSKMKDKDEQQSSNVNKLIKTVEDLLKTSFDFDGAFKVLKEAIAFRNWLNDCKCKVEQIEDSIIKTTEKNVATLETMKKDLIRLLEVIESINLKLIEKYVKIMEQVEEEKKVLTKLGNNLDLLKEKVIAKAELEAESARLTEAAEAEAKAEAKAREEAAAREVAEMIAKEAAEAAAKQVAETVAQIPINEAPVTQEIVEVYAQDDATLDRNGSEESTIPLEEVRKDDDDLFIDAESSLADDVSLTESGPKEDNHEEANENIEIIKEESVEEEVGTTMTDWKQYYNQLATWLRTNDDILDVLEEKPFTTIQSIEEYVTQIETMREERLTKLKQGLDLIENIRQSEGNNEDDDLKSKAKSDLEDIEAKLNEINDKGDKLKTKFQDIIESHKKMVEKVEELTRWMDEVDLNVANNDLKADLLEKREKLDSLERFKKTLDSKADELEKLRQQVDQLNGLLDEEVTTLNERHETLNGSLDEAINKWTKFVNDHSGLDNLHQMCKEINAKTALRLKESEEMDDLEDKLAELNDLINSKEAKVTFDRLDEQLQRVLYQTSNPARTNISNPIRDTIRERNETLNKLKSLRATTNEKFALLQQSQMALKQATKALDEIEYAIVEASLFTCSLSEKKSQWDKAKQLLRDCKLIDISSLSEKPDIAKEYAALVIRHEAALGKLHDLMESNERAYKDHQAFKESCDDVVQWMKNLKDRIPSLSAGCLSDRLSLETTISTLNDLLNRRSAGDEKLNNMKELGAIALETSSTDGKKLINRNTDNLEKDYASLLGEIEKTIEHLQVLMVELKKFKEEYEDTNEWLQSMESEIKQERTICRGATLQEKQANVAICNKLMEQLEKGREETIGKLWKKDVLLKSHLENYIRNQLKLLESRYQVLTNLFKDVASKVNEIAENHELFHNKCVQAQNWIKNASDKLESMAGSYEGKREAIEAVLKSVGEIIKRNQEEGQVCVHQALSAGEKALRSAPSQGRDVISLEIHEIQSKWDRYLNKVSETKSDLEMALIQCQEQQLARNKMKQWLKEQEARAATLKETNSTDEYGSLKENLKSKMRKLNSLLQDLESHPDVHSVTKSSPELQSLYDKLMTEVKDNINEIQTKLDQIEDFNNYCQELKDWLARSKEDLSRCGSTIENRDSINEKVALLKKLTDDEEGSEKLRAAIRCADLCKKNLTPERCSQLDEEIARLSGELDSHKAAISQVKSTLDVGLAKWAEYDTQFLKCSSWLAYIEPLLKEFTEPQTNLLAKRSKLEEFQSTHLQSIFDWQTEFHILNVKAQLLLETHADSSISAAFTQLSARYNDLVASAKDSLHALQQRFQEHQQQQSILTECAEFVDKTKEKLEIVRKHLSSSSLEELNTNLTKTRGLLDSLKGQGETKMSYLEDLTSKVVEHTHSDGVNDVKEDIVQLKSDFDTLLKEAMDTRSSFEVKIDEINQFEKIWNSVIEWFENDVEAAMGKLEKDGDKRILLNLLRLIEKDVNTHQELIASLTEFKDKFPQANEFLTNRYHPRVEVLSETINRLIEEIKTDEKFKIACKEAQDWIKAVHVSFDGLAEKPSDKESIKQRLTMLESTANDANLEKVLKLIVWANELGKEEDEKEFSQEVDWIMATIEEWKIKSNNCLENWINYETLYGNLLDWCTSKNREYSNEDYPSDQVELLLNEVADKKKDFDKLNCLMDSLIPLANTSLLKEDFINLTSMYSSLVSSLRKKVEKIRTVKEAKSKFDNTEQQLSDWINETIEAIEKSFENPSDRLNYLKGIQNTVAIGSSLISSATELAARLSNEDDKLGSKAKSQLDQVKDRFDQITSQLNGEVKSLTRQLDRYEEYNTNLDSLAQWLKDNPEVFESTLSCKGDLFELKATADKLKILSTAIDKNSSCLTKLREEVGSDPRLGARIDYLIEQYNQAASNVASLLNKIDHDTNRIQCYQQLLQSIEKWLLQQSYQLMAHLSLSINTLSQCRSELAKHRKILNDIETYGALEELKKLGEEIVTECGYDREKMMSQYNNLKETFEALIGQGKRIEAQLNYALEKFEIYEQTLARCEGILNERMGKDIRMEFPPLQEAVEELEKAKSVHDKLFEAKSELQAAIQGCSEATAAVSRPPSPEIPINQGLMIPEREVEIKCRLEDSLDYVKQQITSIQELIEQWKDSEHKMGHYFIVDIVRLFRRIHRPS